jgi:hypothetical protein
MRRSALSLIVYAALGCAQAADQATPPSQERPGYGVVESVTPVPREESSSTGATQPGIGHAYLIRVRMSDGSVQIRSQKGRNFKTGDRVLLTNAGDIVKDWK